MARIPSRLSDAEQAVVAAERDAHPDLHVRRKMLVLWSVHTGLSHQLAGVNRATVQRYRADGIDGLRRWGVAEPVSALTLHADTIKASLTDRQ